MKKIEKLNKVNLVSDNIIREINKNTTFLIPFYSHFLKKKEKNT